MDAELILEDTPNGLQVSYRDRRLYGRRPMEDAARRAAAVSLPPDTLVLWTSPVLWHGWDELRHRLLGRSAVIAVEADPLLRELARRNLPADCDHIRLTSTARQAIVGALREYGQYRFRRVVELSTASSAMLDRPAYRAARDLLDREIRVFWQNRLTISAMGRLWVRNLIQNLSELTHAAPLSAVGSPTVICGAGPSLEHSLAFIARNRSRITLLAVDTAVPILAAHGFVPDLVVGLEAQLANVYDFLPVCDRSYRLVADLSSAPAAATIHRSVSWTLTEFAPLSIFDRLSSIPGISRRVPPLGSVGVAAVDLALQLHGSPLFLTGLDFAIAPGKTHARGAPSYLHGLIHADRLHPTPDPAIGARVLTLPGIVGPVLTTLVLKGYASELTALLNGRADVFVLAPSGLEIGARPLRIEEADGLLGGLADRSDTDDGGHAPTIPEDEVRRTIESFVEREIDLLHGFETRLATLSELPPEIDYLACELPDLITTICDRLDLAPLDDGSRARLVIAAGYYRSRWEATLARLSASS